MLGKMNRIKELRQSKGLTQAELATKLGVTRQAVSLYEKDQRKPKIETLKKLAEYFGVSVTYIKGETKTEMLTKIINTMYLIICNRISMSSDREAIDNTENSRTIAATELMLLMYQVLNLDHNKQFKEIVSKNANLLGITGKSKTDYIRESSISATDENYQSDIENAKAWIKFYENF